MEAARIALVAAALVAGASTLSCADSSVHTATYATMTEAREAGAVEKGWVPGSLPDDVYELRAAYDLDDPARRWGLFNFRDGDHDALRATEIHSHVLARRSFMPAQPMSISGTPRRSR